mmetsp:Transcript_1712/g.5186  ORF Transcript_1712/g.5186 Transcript_1712/m.5186 type:complete len:208 (+) Transcript_1712:203-826(+)
MVNGPIRGLAGRDSRLRRCRPGRGAPQCPRRRVLLEREPPNLEVRTERVAPPSPLEPVRRLGQPRGERRGRADDAVRPQLRRARPPLEAVRELVAPHSVLQLLGGLREGGAHRRGVRVLEHAALEELGRVGPGRQPRDHRRTRHLPLQGLLRCREPRRGVCPNRKDSQRLKLAERRAGAQGVVDRVARRVDPHSRRKQCTQLFAGRG